MKCASSRTVVKTLGESSWGWCEVVHTAASHSRAMGLLDGLHRRRAIAMQRVSSPRRQLLSGWLSVSELQ